MGRNPHVSRARQKLHHPPDNKNPLERCVHIPKCTVEPLHCFPQGLKEGGGGGGLSTLKLFMPGHIHAYTTILCCVNKVKRGGGGGGGGVLRPLPPFGETLHSLNEDTNE